MKKNILFAALILGFFSCQNTDTEMDLINKAAKIHAEAITIDTHVDTPLRLYRDSTFSLGELHSFKDGGGQVDFPRMEIGELDGVFFAVFTGQGKRDDETHKAVKEKALKIFDTIYKSVEQHPEIAKIAISSTDIIENEKNGLKSVYLGIENGYPVGTDIQNLKEFYELGARYITLCHTKNNDICDSANDEEEHGGLSEFGKEVVKEMNNLGMMVDVSHISDKAFYDVISLSKSPIIASHSGARTVCDNPRNMTDDMLKKIANNGGVVQVVFLSDYVKTFEENDTRYAARGEVFEQYGPWGELSDSEKDTIRAKLKIIDQKFPRKYATVSDLVDHIDHIVKVAGINHVGIGTDFDGGGGIEGCMDVSDLGNVTLELVKRGYSESDIKKIWGENLLRVFSEVEKYSNGIKN